MATTPESEKIKALNAELDSLIGKYQVLAGDSKDYDIPLLHLCELLSDAQHKARRVLRLLEL